MSPFQTDYDQALKICRANNFDDNWDHRRFGTCVPSPIPSLKQRVKSALVRLGLYHDDGAAAQIATRRAAFEWLFDRLLDNESRQTLVQVLCYRALGHRRVKLPLNNADYWAALARIEALSAGADTIDLGFNGWQAYRLNLASLGYPIELFARPPGVLAQLVLQQYRCTTPTATLEVAPGDVVIDGGGCYGDTALYFAHKAGSGGRVYSFEFMPENLNIFRRNLDLNPELAPRIRIVEHPLWSSSGKQLYLSGSGPATQVTEHPRDATSTAIAALSIDDLVDREAPDRVDFIKMDIEGAETEALVGAQETIRRFRPKLAISVYHSLDDFAAIPRWIEGLGLGYTFALRHFTIHQEETVLFAFPAMGSPAP